VDVSGFSRVIRVPKGVPHSEQVRLVLVIPAVREEQHAETRLRDAAETSDILTEDGAHAERKHTELLTAQLFDRMPGGDVADLVSDDRGELRLGIEVREDPASHVDVPTRKRERVDHRVIHDLEAPGEIGPLRGRCESLADSIDVRLDLCVVVQGHRRLDLLRVRPPHLDLLPFADERQHAAPGRRIRSARGHSERDTNEQHRPARRVAER
jgi:hypothetical protein